MKLLAVFFLVGLALASAVPLFDDDLETEIDQIYDEIGDEFVIYAEGGLGARLRERFEQLIERIKKGADEGKGVSGDLMKKAQDFFDKLKNLGVEISDKFKQIFEDLRSKLPGNAPEHAEGGLFDRLRKRFEELLEKIKKGSDEGNGVSERLMKIAQDLYDKLKNLGVEISEKFQNLFEELKSKIGGNAPQHADFKELLRKLRDRIQNHEFDEEKIRTFVENLFGKSEITNQILAMLKSKGEKGKQRIVDFINRILGDKQEAFPFIDKLKIQFEEMLEKMQKSFEDGKVVSENMWKKLQDIYEKLKNLGVEFSDKVQQIYEDLKSKFSNQSVQHVEFSIISRIKERLENLINRMKKNVDDGQGVKGDLWKKLQDVYEKFRNLGGELSEKMKQTFEDLRSRFDKSRSFEQHSVKEIFEKVKKFFKDLNIELKEKFVKFGEYVKEQYHKALDKTKSNVENVKNIANKFVEDSRRISKDMAEEALEFFRPYKQDLGHIWDDVVDKVRDILKKDN